MFHREKVQYLRLFNLFAIAGLIAITSVQVYAFVYFLSEVDSQRSTEALFGISMLAMLSLWLVVPSVFTSFKLLKTHSLQSKCLLLLCVVQCLIILWALIT